MIESSNKVIKRLISSGLVANDVEVLSTHNNLVLRSPSAGIVSRIANLASMQAREDPGDICYSHEAAWVSGEVASVTKPLTRYPVQDGDFVVSNYPERQTIDWGEQNVAHVVAAVGGLNNSLEYLASFMELRILDIPAYTTARIHHAREYGSLRMQGEVDGVARIIEDHGSKYPFHELMTADKGLVHGDLHQGNLVRDGFGNVEIIDMDSLAVGPKTYDIASWRVRDELGDSAPVQDMVAYLHANSECDAELFHALMGWKIISSMTHVLRHEKTQTSIRNKINKLGRCAIVLGALHTHVGDDV